MVHVALILAAVLPICDWATNSVTKRIVGADPTVCLARFLDYPPEKRRLEPSSCLLQNPFRPNPMFWLKDVDFSCVSPWNDSFGTLRAGTLISKRHIVFAKHFPLGKGVRIVFTDNVIGACPCYVGESKAVRGTDIQVAVLESEVSPNIKPARVLPSDFARYIGGGNGLPVVTFNRREEVVLSQISGITSNAVVNSTSSIASWQTLQRKIVVGDSGNPAFLLIGNEPVLLYCLLLGGVGHGPALHGYNRKIQAVMDELCPGYKLETFDFSKVEIPNSRQ